MIRYVRIEKTNYEQQGYSSSTESWIGTYDDSKPLDTIKMVYGGTAGDYRTNNTQVTNLLALLRSTYEEPEV